MKAFERKLYQRYRQIRRFLSEMASYRVSLYSANASFYMILSLFPAVMLIVALLPLLGFTQADLLSAIRGLLPEVLMPLMERIVSDASGNSSGVLVSVSALVMIWSSSRSVYCIQRGLNAIHGLRESRSFLRLRLTSMFYMVFLIAALLATLLLHGFGQEVTAFCESKNIPILHFVAKLLQFRGLILCLLLTLLFAAIYCVFPNRKQRFRSVLPGAALAALGWLVFSLFFSLYVRAFSSYSMLYGSLSIIAIGMLWLYICISILFYGSVVNLLLQRRKKSSGDVR